MESSVYLSVCANASDSNVTSELWLVEDKTSGQVLAAFLLLFLVIGLPWNLLVIVTIVKERLYTQPTIILLLSFAVTDLVLLVFQLPLRIVVGFQGEYIFGSSDHVRCLVCCNTGFISILFSLNSIFTISLMSIDRFLFIYKPLHYEQYVTKWRIVVVIAVGWLIAIVIAILPLVGFGDIAFSRQQVVSCGINANINSRYYGILVVLVACLAIIPLLVSNIWVCCIVQRNIRVIYKVRKSMKISSKTTSDRREFYRSMKKKRCEKEVHLFKVFGNLLGASAMTWFPIIVLTLLSFSGVRVPSPISVLSRIFFSSQTVVHLVIETTLIKEVRVPLKNIVFCCCTAVKAKMFSDKDIGRSGQKSGHHNTENGVGNSHSCCKCDLLDVCGAALLFDHSKDITNDIEASQVTSEKVV